MRFAVNLSLLFSELPLLERPRAAADAGFEAVELWWPFDNAEPDDAAVDAFKKAITDAGVSLIGLNFDAGDMPGGDRGLVSLPGEAERFRRNIPVALDIAASLGCTALNALYGNRQDGVDPKQQDELAVENLTAAAAAARQSGATVLVEQVNPIENPRYPLGRAADALVVIDRVAEQTGEHLGFLCDLYHMQRTEGNLIDNVRAHADRIAHVQIADSPGRNQPGTGEIAYGRVLDALEETGYDGWVALEYKPAGPTLESLEWLPAQARSSAGTARPSAAVIER